MRSDTPEQRLVSFGCFFRLFPWGLSLRYTQTHMAQAHLSRSISLLTNQKQRTVNHSHTHTLSSSALLAFVVIYRRKSTSLFLFSPFFSLPPFSPLMSVSEPQQLSHINQPPRTAFRLRISTAAAGGRHGRR